MVKNSSDAWRRRYSEWLHYVTKIVRTVDFGEAIQLGPSREPLVPPGLNVRAAKSAQIAYCAPHPDDECMSGALAVRLRLEAGAQVTDIAVTMGSAVDQRTRRLRELESACRALGFDLIVPLHPAGFDHVNLKTRQQQPLEWESKVETLCEIFDRGQPDIVFAPHAEDFNSTHMGTHFLVRDALARHLERLKRGPIPLVETEFWHPLAAPNLMVGCTAEVVAIQLVAAAEHGGEMARNLEHLRHACRLMDNVRRGSEVIGGQGAAAQRFVFAELYRVTFVRGLPRDEELAPRPGGWVVGPGETIDLPHIIDHFWPAGLGTKAAGS